MWQIIGKFQRRACAWCNAERGRSQGNGSHGICKRHQKAEYAKLQAYKLAKIQAKVVRA